MFVHNLQQSGIDLPQAGSYDESSEYLYALAALPNPVDEFNLRQQHLIVECLEQGIPYDFVDGQVVPAIQNHHQLPMSDDPGWSFAAMSYVDDVNPDLFRFNEPGTQLPVHVELHNPAGAGQFASYPDQPTPHVDHRSINTLSNFQPPMQPLDSTIEGLLFCPPAANQQYNSFSAENYTDGLTQSSFEVAQPSTNPTYGYANENVTTEPRLERSYTAPDLFESPWLDGYGHVRRHSAPQEVEFNHQHQLAPHLQNFSFTQRGFQSQEHHHGTPMSSDYWTIPEYNPNPQYGQTQQIQNTVPVPTFIFGSAPVQQIIQDRPLVRNIRRRTKQQPKRTTRGPITKRGPTPKTSIAKVSLPSSPPPPPSLSNCSSIDDALLDFIPTPSPTPSPGPTYGRRKKYKVRTEEQEEEGRVRNRVAADKSRCNLEIYVEGLIADEKRLRAEYQALRSVYDKLCPEWYSVHTGVSDVADDCFHCRARFLKHKTDTKDAYAIAHRPLRNIDAEANEIHPAGAFKGGMTRAKREPSVDPQFDLVHTPELTSRPAPTPASKSATKPASKPASKKAPNSKRRSSDDAGLD